MLMAAPPVGSVIPPHTDELLASQMAALEKNRKELEQADNFRKRPESSSVTGASLSERDSLGALVPVRTPYSAYRASPKSSAKVRPRGFASPESTPTPSLSRLGSGGKPMAAPDTLAASSATRLRINPSPKPKLKLSFQTDSTGPSPLKIGNGVSMKSGQTPQKPATPTTPATPNGMNTPNGTSEKGYDYYQQVVGSPGDVAAGSAPKAWTVPCLTKGGYSCTPTIAVLSTLPAEDLAAVPNFSVERPGVGKIEWEGAVDIRGINLDEVVVIEPKSASVYTREEEQNTKPAVGTKLNRSAIITLEGVYPSEATLEAQDKLSKKVQRQTSKMGAELIDYDATTGIWKLRVRHFSRYGLDDDDDSSSEAEVVETKVHFESGEREGRSRAKGEEIRRQATPYKPPRVLKSAPVVVEDEGDYESEDDVIMSDESKILVQAEAAFATLQTVVQEQRISSRKRREETGVFVEEIGSEPKVVQDSRYIPSFEDLLAASSRSGVCAGIAKKAGAEKSSIDYGKRLGRSFRVGWSPDGSFFCRNKDGNLVRRRPKFAADMSSVEGTIQYLKQHQANSEKVGVKGDCPQFSLPSGSGLGGALSSYVDNSTSAINGAMSIAKESFALLKCLGKGANADSSGSLALLGEGVVGGGSLEARRLFAIQQWLIDSCSKEVSDEVRRETTNTKKYAALLAAISGGKAEKACTVAEDLGFHQLASMLAAGPEARVDILKEVMAWTDSGAASNIPDDLIRSYFLLGGDLKMEEDIFKRKYSPYDWRRRLVMSLTYGPKTSTSGVAALVTDYENKVARGLAPFPQPRYLAGKKSAEKIECVSYRLLRLGRHELEIPLREIVDPRGHTISVHDFSLSFHLAAAISAMGCSAPLSTVEEQMLIDGYAAQLVAGGNWEWAVYVLLCQFGQATPSLSAWKRQQAKSLVLQNFREFNADRRYFLESMGVPKVWFEEALALQCSVNGDAIGYLSHMVKVNPDEACASLENTFIPNMFFMDKETLAEARIVLDAFSVDSGSLAGAVFDFFYIYEDILRLAKAAQKVIDSTVPSLLERCEQVEHTFASYQSGEAKLQGPTLRIVPGTRTVPMACFLAEGLSQISLFKLQLRALKSQLSLSSTATQILNLAQPSDMMDSGISARENILRWLM
jgi:nuclear pore complex protein Nup98-Nup96